jgi:hypothetical protein
MNTTTQGYLSTEISKDSLSSAILTGNKSLEDLQLKFYLKNHSVLIVWAPIKEIAQLIFDQPIHEFYNQEIIQYNEKELWY